MKRNEYYRYHGMTASECSAKAKEKKAEAEHLLREAISGDDRQLRHMRHLPSNIDEICWDLTREAEELTEASTRLKKKDLKRNRDRKTVLAN